MPRIRVFDCYKNFKHTRGDNQICLENFRTAFFRNDDGHMVDDGPEINADLPMSGMGMGQADLNEDGFSSTNKPFFLWEITDRIPDTFVPITEHPHAIASSTVFGKPS